MRVLWQALLIGIALTSAAAAETKFEDCKRLSSNTAAWLKCEDRAVKDEVARVEREARAHEERQRQEDAALYAKQVAEVAALKEACATAGGFHIGVNEDRVLTCFGTPNAIHRVTTGRGRDETWVYRLIHFQTGEVRREETFISISNGIVTAYAD